INTTGALGVSDFLQTNGTVNGPSDLDASTTFHWTGGTQAAGGATVVGTLCVGTIDGTGNPVLSGRNLVLNGVLHYLPASGGLTITGPGALAINSGTLDLDNG